MYTVRTITAQLGSETIRLPIFFSDNLTSLSETFRVEPVDNNTAAISAALQSVITNMQAQHGLNLRMFNAFIYDRVLYEAYATDPVINTIYAAQQDAEMFTGVQLLDSPYQTPIVKDGDTLGYYSRYSDSMVWSTNAAASGNCEIACFTAQAASSPVYQFMQASIPIFPVEVLVGDHIDLTRLPSGYGSLVHFIQFFGYFSTAVSGNFVYGSVEQLIVVNRSARVADVADLLVNASLDAPDTPDPYTSAGYPASTAPGGASSGSFNFTEDGITGVHTPGLDLLNTGLITAWRPSKATLAQLAGWLWVTTPGQVIQQLFGNPINAIIGLNIVPVSPPVDGGTNTIKFGNEDSHVACPKITNQHVTVDCGSLKISPKYGSYMDYAPQASAELFLPYVGGLPLDMNDVMDKTINVKYQVDVLSGACVAYVFINGVLHYQKAGGCAATAPITGSQMPNVVSGVLSIVGSVAGAVASMGASGAGTAAKVASGIATGTSVAESAANMMKQSVSYAGTISGWAGLLGAQKPYLILSLPHAAIPGGQNTLMGYPAWVSGRVGDFTGYTECTVDRVTATRATDQEVEEIKGLLEGGVIL